MRILFHVPKASYFLGGTENFILMLGEELSRRKNGRMIYSVGSPVSETFLKRTSGWDADIIASPLLRSDTPFMHALVRRIPSLPLYRRFFSTNYHWDLESFTFNLTASRKYRRLSYDAASVHYYMDLALFPDKKPIVFHFHGAHDTPVRRRLLRKASFYVAHGRFLTDAVRKLYGIKAEFLWDPVDCGHFRPLPLGKKYDVLFVGRLVSNKGVPFLLKLCEKIPSLRFAVAGGGPLEGEVRTFAKRHSHLDYLGPVPRAKLPELYNSARLLLCPSLYEPFGVVNIEAMACGIPVVASRTGGIPEAVDESVGRLFEPGNLEECRKEVEVLLASDAERKELGRNGRRRCLSDFAVEKVADQFLQIYGKAIS